MFIVSCAIAGRSRRYVRSGAVLVLEPHEGVTSCRAPVVVSPIVIALVIAVTPSWLRHASLASPADLQVTSPLVPKSVLPSPSLSAPSPHSGQFGPTPGQ